MSTTCASQRLAHMQFHCQQLLESTRPRHKVQLKSWISEQTWRAMEQLHRARQLLRIAQQAGTCTPEFEYSLRSFLSQQPLLCASIAQFPDFACLALHDFIERLSHATKVQLRREKRSWLQSQCEHAANNWQDSKTVFATVRMLVGKRRAISNRALRVDPADTEVSVDPDFMSKAWTEHWRQHFGGSVCYDADFSLTHIPQGTNFGHADTNLVQADDTEFSFTEEEVMAAFKAASLQKSAPDVLHPRFWPQLQHIFIPLLTRHFNDIVHHQHIPHAYHGASLVPVPKKGSSALLVDGHRPVAIMLFEAKLLSRVLHRRLYQWVVSSARFPESQFATGPAVGTDIAHFVAEQLTSYTLEQEHSMALLFVDVRSAFDCVLWNLLTGETGAADFLGQSAIVPSPEQCQLLEFVRSHPSCLVSMQLPPCLLATLQEWIRNTWYTSHRSPCLASSPSPSPPGLGSSHPPAIHVPHGVRQGDNISTLLFALYLNIALLPINSLLESLSHPFLFPRYVSRTLDTVCSVSVTSILHLEFADDLLIPLRHPSPAALIDELVRVAREVHCSFSAFNLMCNYAPNKTAALLHLNGRLGPRLWQSIKSNSIMAGVPSLVGTDQRASADDEAVGPCPSTVPALSLPLFVGVTLPIVSQYKYLGWIATANGSPIPELKERARTAQLAFSTHRRVLTSPKFTLAQKLHLYKALVLVHFTQSIHTHRHLPKKELCTLSHLYVSQLRIIALSAIRSRLDPVNHDLTPVSDNIFLTALGQPPLADIFLARQLGFLARLIVSDHAFVRAALALSHVGSLKHSFVEAVSLFQSRAVHWSELVGMEAPCEANFHHWIQFVVFNHALWKRTLKS
eukprot:4603041-Amphidinium_carterae.1